ncbi:hypothetical protein SD80_011585 [Scytonema tolypothrichoides VB-61278]|nr:hypothetical protein SD80_011585 [Scytonema tolypothrichoides VB-61278]
MTDIPPIDTKTTSDLVTLGQERALAVSAGRLNDFSPGSPVIAILEAVATQGSQIITTVNSLGSTLERNRLSLFGVERRQGTNAVGTIGVRLDGLYADPFVLPRGFRVVINGIQFETTADLGIPAYTDYGTVPIISLTPGSRGNVSQLTPVSFPSVRRLGAIALTEPTRNGQDAETEAEFQQRIYGLLRRRETLISEDDFEAAVIDFLGVGSTALSIGRLKPDKITYQNGYVGVFGLNTDGSALSTGQISALSDLLNRKAAMATITVWTIDTFTINVDIVVAIQSGVLPDAIALSIQQNVRDFLFPGKLPAGESIYPKALEARIQAIPGVVLGVIDVKLNGFAMPQPMPHLWTVGVLGMLKVTVNLNGGKGLSISFNY